MRFSNSAEDVEQLCRCLLNPHPILDNSETSVRRHRLYFSRKTRGVPGHFDCNPLRDPKPLNQRRIIGQLHHLYRIIAQYKGLIDQSYVPDRYFLFVTFGKEMIPLASQQLSEPNCDPKNEWTVFKGSRRSLKTIRFIESITRTL